MNDAQVFKTIVNIVCSAFLLMWLGVALGWALRLWRSL